MPRNLFFLLAALIIVSCGEDSKHFKIEGRLLQMNQGEFYVYTIDQSVNGIDTIKVQGGRFSYEIPCQSPSTLTLVFPNFSEMPVFAEPGKTVKIDGDASHLKMLKMKGTKNNELMSSFRERIASASPPEVKRDVERLVNEHPDSPVGLWLLRKYFISTAEPDYVAAERMLRKMHESQPSNPTVRFLLGSVGKLKSISVGYRLPSFIAYDINGRPVSSSVLSSGTAVIIVWASWNYNSCDMLRQLQTAVKSHGVKSLAVSVDPSVYDCRNFVRNNDVSLSVVCTGDMFDTPVLKLLGLQSPCDVIVVKNGKITGRNISSSEFSKEFGNM